MLAALARRINVPYPALLALTGAALALLPGTPSVTLDPQLALALFVAPVLLDAAFDSSPRDLRQNWRAGHQPGARRGRLDGGRGRGRRSVGRAGHAVVRGHCVRRYRRPARRRRRHGGAPSAQGAAPGVRHSRGRESLQRRDGAADLSAGGRDHDHRLLLGLERAADAGGGLCRQRRARLRVLSPADESDASHHGRRDLGDRAVRSTFAVWIAAERIGLSGIITMVVYAIAVARTAPDRFPARLRIPSYAVWEVVVFVLNVLAFILVGLQLKPILQRLSEPSSCDMRRPARRSARRSLSSGSCG